MFQINDDENSGCVEVYPTFGLELIVDYEHETLPSFETAISVLGMNGSTEKMTPMKPRIGPASFKKKLEENAEKDPLAEDVPVEEKKSTPRVGPASFKKKLEQGSSTPTPSAPKMSPFDILRNNMTKPSSSSTPVEKEKTTPRIGPASFKRKAEEAPVIPSSPVIEKPIARVGPASFKRKLDENTVQQSPEKEKPRIGPASFKRQAEITTTAPSVSEEKKVPRVGPASFKRKLEETRETPTRKASLSPQPQAPVKSSSEKPKIGPARFKRKLEEKPESDDDVRHVSVSPTAILPRSDKGLENETESPKAVEKPAYRPGPARFKKPHDPIESDEDEDSDKPVKMDPSNVKSLTLGFIPIKKGGAIANRKSRSPAETADSVTCESCNIVLPSASALRAHDRATHKPVRIAQHLKVKADPRPKRVERSKYYEDSDEEEIPVKSSVGENCKCYQCLKMIPEDEYLEHLVGHDEEARAALDETNSTAELSKGAKLSRRFVFADVNDERNKADDAVIRCFLCTNLLFLNKEDYKHHTQTKHCIIMDNGDSPYSEPHLRSQVPLKSRNSYRNRRLKRDLRSKMGFRVRPLLS